MRNRLGMCSVGEGIKQLFITLQQTFFLKPFSQWVGTILARMTRFVHAKNRQCDILLFIYVRGLASEWRRCAHCLCCCKCTELLLAPADWKMSQNYPLCLSVSPPLLKPCTPSFGHCWPAGRLVVMERCALYAILAGRFFTCVRGEGGWRPFKWSTWRLWPVINEFAVSHGSCKETSGSKRGEGERGRYSDLTGKQFIYARMKNGCTKHAIAYLKNNNPIVK